MPKIQLKQLRPPFFLLLFILGVALFFRTNNIVSLHGFAIDADLYSWIVRDIVVNEHLRLVGQMTSTQGVYAGVGFYYLLVPFFLITKMDPIGAVIFATALGVVTVWSFYWVFKNLLNIQSGLAAAFLQAVLPLRVGFDRWVVPSITINLWCIWFFYSLIKILNGEVKYFILNSFLIGLIWHVHLSLVPLIILLPISILLSKKLPNTKTMLLGLAAFLIPMLPFFIFELRHGFVQTLNILSSFSSNSNLDFLEKVLKILDQSLGKNQMLKIVYIALPVILYKTKTINFKLVVIFYIWIISAIGFFIFSSKESSEYYFTSTQTIILFSIIYLLSSVFKLKKLGALIIGLILGAVLIYSFQDLLNSKGNNKGYDEKMAVARLIKTDSVYKNLPCFSVTYITTPGEDTGFKYLFWFNGIKLQQPKEGIPNYTIVIPYTLSSGSVNEKFGLIGVISAKNEYNLAEVAPLCEKSDFNLTQPLWGYTD